MNGDIRRRIDNARDVLVGKVPDPKTQVEHITIALIYRFMDYMDRQSEEWGGQTRFFTGDFARYAWSNLADRKIGGHERLELYTEALTRMTQNPHLPQLFRDIFKNAFLPYRDPETLRLFLQEIDGFPLDHTEDLGDAYEYLLSIMSSQGDAGQFRTPRHVIDFIVKCVDPRKDETILDPACGTAGFLVSAYLHIMERNAQDGRPGAALSSDEKNALVGHFSGYDISPDMVRLSLVNMYFHGFQSPSIHEYDTLASEERWGENYDVIVANPPFMTPKGGIKPHKRFSVQANRSEVLFVDYIMEHLNPSGRAGVIVPEGIIFQSSTAYKQLRKMLVEDRYLYAVVSLPAGVFNPYAGVKTSILLMDRELAKRTDDILFVKVENDGFDLGAQRRPIDRNDLPEALEIVTAWKRRLLDPSAPLEIEVGKRAHVVPKAKIAASGDFNLTCDRYREAAAGGVQKWPMVEVGEIAAVFNGRTFPKEAYKEQGRLKTIKVRDYDETEIRFDNDERGWIDETCAEVLLLQQGDTLIINAAHSSTHVGAKIGYVGAPLPLPCVPSGEIMVVRANGDILPRLVNSFLRSPNGRQAVAERVTGIHLYPRDVKTIRIPLPPLEVQEQIVAEIDAWQKIIDGAKQVVENYKPTIPIDPAWPTFTLGELCAVKGGKRLPKGSSFSDRKNEHPYIRVVDLRDRTVDTSDLRFVDDAVFSHIRNYTIGSNDVYISIAGTIGVVGSVPRELDGANLTENAAKLVISESSELSPGFLVLILSCDDAQEQIRRLTMAVGVPKLALERIRTIVIPVPPMDVQEQIVAEIEDEQKLVEANKRLIEIHEAKIKAKIAEVWDE